MEPKLDWLQTRLDLDEAQLRKMVLTLPALLSYSVETNMAPKLAYLERETGLSRSELRDRVLKFPQFMSYSLEKRYRPRLEACRAAGVDAEYVLTYVSKTDEKFYELLEEKGRGRAGRTMNATLCVAQVANFGSGAGLGARDARRLGALVEEPPGGRAATSRRRRPARRAHSVVRGRPERGLRGGGTAATSSTAGAAPVWKSNFGRPTPSTQHVPGPHPNSLVDFTQCGTHSPNPFKWDHEEGCSLGSESSSTINEPAQLSRSTAAAASAAPEPTQTHDTQSSASARAVNDPGMSSFTRSPQTPR